MASCSHSDSMSKSGMDALFWKAIASCMGRKARRDSGPSSSRADTQATAAETPIVRVPPATKCHESWRSANFKVAPVLEMTSAGWKSRAHTRLMYRQASLVSRAAQSSSQHGIEDRKTQGTKGVGRRLLVDRFGGKARRVMRFFFSQAS